MSVLVYISSAISKGNRWANARKADRAMIDLVKSGYSVHNPMLTMWAGAAGEVMKSHLNMDSDTSAMVRPEASGHGDFKALSHEDWLDMDKEIVSRCDAVLRIPGESAGADIEVAHAESLNIPVFHSIAALREHFETDDEPA